MTKSKPSDATGLACKIVHLKLFCPDLWFLYHCTDTAQDGICSWQATRPLWLLGMFKVCLTMQAGSLEFLAGQGFDFNKWIYHGVPFMPAEWRDK